MDSAEKKVLDVLNILVSIGTSVIVLISLLAIITVMDPVLLVFSVMPVLFSLPLSMIRNKFNYKMENDLVLDNRKVNYVKKIYYEKNYAKDLRMTKIGNVLSDRFRQSVENLSNLQRKYGKKKWFLGFWETFNQLIIVIYVSYVYLIYNILVVRKFSIGDFSAMFSAVRNVDMNLRRLMQLIPQIQNNGLYIDNFLMLMNYENKVTDGPVEIKKDALKEYSLELKNVSFRYSPNGEEVLRNVDMRIKAGEKIALVGHNGAGKTTLVKLLLRFYDPDSGELYFNGKNIKDYNLESYRNLFGTVFQDFQIYSFSAMENILMDRSCDEYRKDVKEILELIKVSVDPDNALSKEFDKEGIVLSGGQSQKIAIARALIQDSPVLILDEPSSSLDPISEYEMNQYLFELAKDKTVIFISHRLSTTVMADRIYLLENGEIIEVGSHSELLNRNGKYADMFHKQAEKYIDNRNAKDDRTC